MPVISNFPGGSGSGGGGLQLKPVTNIKTVTAAGKVYVQWTDPNDLVVDGTTLAAWGGTLLVRKAGSMPASRRDGVQVLDSKNRNAYRNQYFCDTGLSDDGTTYYYKLFPYTTSGAYTDSVEDEFNATPKPVPLEADVTNMSAGAAGNGKLNIKWTDPTSTVVKDGITVAEWGKTVVVVKKNSIATSPDDKDAVYTYTSTTYNAHASTALLVSGLENGTVYCVTFFPITTDGSVKSGSAQRVTGTPNRLTLTVVPTQSGTLTYNGSTQIPSWNNYDQTKMTMSGDTSKINAGTYYAIFTPKDDYCWSRSMGNEDISPQACPWTINRKTGTLTVTSSAITLDKDHTSVSFSIGGSHDGTLSIEVTAGSTVFDARLSGSTVTVTSKGETAGSGTIVVKCTQGTNYTAPANVSVSVTADFVTTSIYGVLWDGSASTELSRTDAAQWFTNPKPAVNNGNGSSPFDNLLPWSGMKIVDDPIGGKLVSIPKFYYKWTVSGSTLKLQIADGPVDGFYVSPAHADRGDGKGERDTVYVGRYHCASSYKSETGVPRVSVTRSTARRHIKALGEGFYQWDWATLWTIRMLYLVEYASWDSQAKIGLGCSINNSKDNTGKTDSMVYHTGTTAASVNAYGYTQYRYIEGLWDNVYDWVDGCYYIYTGLYVIMNPENFSDTSGGVNIGKPTAASSLYGCPSSFAVCKIVGYEWCMVPTAQNGTYRDYSSYVPDTWYYDAYCSCLYCGGGYSQSKNVGMFCVFSDEDTMQDPEVGCRIMKLS